MPSFVITPRGKRIVSIVKKLPEIANDILDVAKDGVVDDEELVNTFGMRRSDANTLLINMAKLGLIRRGNYKAQQHMWTCRRCGDDNYELFGSPSYPLCESCYRKYGEIMGQPLTGEDDKILKIGD